jgi:hypothetical protein
MAAHRAVKDADTDLERLRAARKGVDASKAGLGSADLYGGRIKRLTLIVTWCT